MPVVENSTYRPPPGLGNPHVQMVWCSLGRVVPEVRHTRELVPTPDGDMLHLDWVSRLREEAREENAPRRTLVILHGLESHARLPYINATALSFLRRGWEVAALNFRDCGDTPNLLWQSYHSGVSRDVETLVHHLLEARPGRRLALVGYSLGGNVLLKYLGAHAADIPSAVVAAAAVSAPVDVACAVTQLSHPRNSFYNWRFLRQMRWKLRRRCERFPGLVDAALIPRLRTFQDFDDLYTAPAHGFENAIHYWAEASSRPHLEAIRVPTYLINAQDDPFLGPDCYPFEAARANPLLTLEVPAQGSHIGFVRFGGPDGEHWHETRIRDFLEERLPAEG
jgi:predicted alpha/beta-fold hydrolase